MTPKIFVLLLLLVGFQGIQAFSLQSGSFYVIQNNSPELLNTETGQKERFEAGSTIRVKRFRNGIYALEVTPHGRNSPLPTTYHLWKGNLNENSFQETVEMVLNTQQEVEHLGDSPGAGDRDCVSQSITPPQENFGNCPNTRFHNRKVLYLGDSHSYMQTESTNRMGRILSDALDDCPGSSLEYRAACGNRASHWHADRRPNNMCGMSSNGSAGFTSNTSGNFLKNLSEEIEAESPGEVVINLGDNMFRWGGTPRTASFPASEQNRVRNEVRTLLAQLPAQTKCIWIGPTYHDQGSSYRKSNDVVDLMYNALREGIGQRCDLIDSRPFFSSTTANDGLHFTNSESIQWGNSILNEMREL